MKWENTILGGILLYFGHSWSPTPSRQPLFETSDTIGQAYTAGKQIESNDICMATRMTARCRTDCKHQHCIGMRLSHTIWSSFRNEALARGYRICVAVRLLGWSRGESAFSVTLFTFTTMVWGGCCSCSSPEFAWFSTELAWFSCVESA